MRILTTLLFLTLSSCGTIKTKSDTVHNSKVEPSEFMSGGIDYSKSYAISDNEYGTKTSVSLEGGNRVMKTNALPNHATGKFPNAGNPNTISAQNKKYAFPLEPKLSGESIWAREPGVALNGVKFEPETAERFICETGEIYRIEAFQKLVDLGLDFNNAHVQPTGAYHYHGVPEELVKVLDTGEDMIQIGFALDGFPIYYSKSGRYKPSYQLADELRTGDACSYRNPKQGMDKELQDTRPDGTFVSDWEYVPGFGQLDECNGAVVNGQYVYFVTDEYPYMSRCLKGVFEEKRPKGPPPGHSHNGGPPHRH